MSGLERSSPPLSTTRCAGCAGGTVLASYRTRHRPAELLPRHPHSRGFAAIVLSGRYVEAGDSGRHVMEPGDVLIHRAWERHLDQIDTCGAEVLVLDLGDRISPFLRARIEDPDAILRLAESDPRSAVDRVIATAITPPVAAADWPELLAEAIRADPSLSISDWARDASLHIGSVSRGFRQVFGITPKAYRLAQRTLHAIDTILTSRRSLSATAHDWRFADQAHMARAIKAATNMSAGALRR